MRRSTAQILLIGVVVLGTLSARIQATTAQEHHHHVGAAELEAAPFLPTSIYQLTSQWQNAVGETMPLSARRGRPQILTMFYSSCTDACPVLLENVKRIERSFERWGIHDVGFVLVTFDPARDTVEALKHFTSTRALDHSWVLLRGSLEDTQELAAVLGMKFTPNGSGGFLHSNIIALLDSQGRVAHRHAGLRLSDREITQFVSALRPSSSPLLPSEQEAPPPRSSETPAH